MFFPNFSIVFPKSASFISKAKDCPQKQKLYEELKGKAEITEKFLVEFQKLTIIKDFLQEQTTDMLKTREEMNSIISVRTIRKIQH